MLPRQPQHLGIQLLPLPRQRHRRPRPWPVQARRGVHHPLRLCAALLQLRAVPVQGGMRGIQRRPLVREPPALEVQAARPALVLGPHGRELQLRGRKLRLRAGQLGPATLELGFPLGVAGEELRDEGGDVACGCPGGGGRTRLGRGCGRTPALPRLRNARGEREVLRVQRRKRPRRLLPVLRVRHRRPPPELPPRRGLRRPILPGLPPRRRGQLDLDLDLQLVPQREQAAPDVVLPLDPALLSGGAFQRGGRRRRTAVGNIFFLDRRRGGLPRDPHGRFVRRPPLLPPALPLPAAIHQPDRPALHHHPRADHALAFRRVGNGERRHRRGRPRSAPRGERRRARIARGGADPRHHARHVRGEPRRGVRCRRPGGGGQGGDGDRVRLGGPQAGVLGLQGELRRGRCGCGGRRCWSGLRVGEAARVGGEGRVPVRAAVSERAVALCPVATGFPAVGEGRCGGRWPGRFGGRCRRGSGRFAGRRGDGQGNHLQLAVHHLDLAGRGRCENQRFARRRRKRRRRQSARRRIRLRSRPAPRGPVLEHHLPDLQAAGPLRHPRVPRGPDASPVAAPWARRDEVREGRVHGAADGVFPGVRPEGEPNLRVRVLQVLRVGCGAHRNAERHRRLGRRQERVDDVPLHEVQQGGKLALPAVRRRPRDAHREAESPRLLLRVNLGHAPVPAVRVAPAAHLPRLRQPADDHERRERLHGRRVPDLQQLPVPRVRHEPQPFGVERQQQAGLHAAQLRGPVGRQRVAHRPDGQRVEQHLRRGRRVRRQAEAYEREVRRLRVRQHGGTRHLPPPRVGPARFPPNRSPRSSIPERFPGRSRGERRPRARRPGRRFRPSRGPRHLDRPAAAQLNPRPRGRRRRERRRRHEGRACAGEIAGSRSPSRITHRTGRSRSYASTGQPNHGDGMSAKRSPPQSHRRGTYQALRVMGAPVRMCVRMSEVEGAPNDHAVDPSDRHMEMIVVLSACGECATAHLFRVEAVPAQSWNVTF
ncbi:hypothetical protein DFJ74DRAFT_208175 [Hyaloraphidium curvatum]|nr:hypothetical protein DFJ74DRAFT_208175 [Hyaloraphidium curvatum]